MFPTSKNRSKDKSVQNLKVRFGINTYQNFRSGSTRSSGPHRKFWSRIGSTSSSFSHKTTPSSTSHQKFRSRTGSTGSPDRYFLVGITPSSGPQIRHSIYVFWPSRRVKHNGEVCYTFCKLHKMNIFGGQQVSGNTQQVQLVPKTQIAHGVPW
jgi:hypothetical protein